MSDTVNSEVKTNVIPMASTSTSTSTSNAADSTVGVISTTTPEIQTQDLCIARGCNNAAIQHPEWDNEYCSVSCTYKHCKETFLVWLDLNKSNKSIAELNANQANSAATPNEEQSTTT